MNNWDSSCSIFHCFCIYLTNMINLNVWIWELGAGVLAATFVCPLDVIKTRFQVHGLPKLGSGNIKGASFFFLDVQVGHIIF